MYLYKELKTDSRVIGLDSRSTRYAESANRFSPPPADDAGVMRSAKCLALQPLFLTMSESPKWPKSTLIPANWSRTALQYFARVSCLNSALGPLLGLV